ncbi:MAG: hypothetical protein ACRC5R_05920 [Mycoplasmatales bacterium]
MSKIKLYGSIFLLLCAINFVLYQEYKILFTAINVIIVGIILEGIFYIKDRKNKK